MANCIAYCYGHDKNRTKMDHRLGSESADGEVATWHTEAEAHICKDGSGYVEVRCKNTGTVLHRFDFPSEEVRRLRAAIKAS